MWGCNVYKDAWSATVGTSWLYLFFPPRTFPSLRGQSSQVLAKCWIVHNTPYFSECLASIAILAFSLHALHHGLFVHNGFYHSLIWWLISSIRQWGRHGLCQRISWTLWNSITIVKTIIFFYIFSTEISKHLPLC